MKKNPAYSGAKYIGNKNDCYGEKVIAYFYVGDTITEGEPFGNTEETAYIDDMGAEWQKGHMLARSLGGDNKAHNLLPMKEDVNNSTFKSVENFVHTLINNLSAIQRECKVGPLHIKYTIERVENTTIVVNGHKFPGKFRYSIDILKNDDQIINTVSLYDVLNKLNIEIGAKFTDILSVK